LVILTSSDPPGVAEELLQYPCETPAQLEIDNSIKLTAKIVFVIASAGKITRTPLAVNGSCGGEPQVDMIFSYIILVRYE
jgi:hypothetical protein